MPKVPFWVFILIAILYFCAVRLDTMDIDASQYAEISREMMKSGDYLHIYDRGMEYLDKPPFLFWVSALSMKVFGVNNFGYKLPSILFALWAIFATYRLARLLYNDTTARMAALILASCQGMFLMVNDVRCDTILMSWTVTAIWLIKEWEVQKKMSYLIGGFAAIAFGMMTKGPIALMVPVFCFTSDWALKREWRMFFKPVYLVGVVVMAALLVPMSIGLYQQFDMHPEKFVNGKTGTSGLRFFYWSQSFGRITGESPWKNGVDMSFLLMNMLWSFLPWIFLFLPALVVNIAQVIRQKFRLQPHQEWVTTGGFLLTYLALGSSAYQLPHYIFIAFPLAAIMTAKLLYDLVVDRRYNKLYRFAQPMMVIVSLLLLIASLLLIAYVFPAPVYVIILWLAGLALCIYLIVSKKIQAKLLWVPVASIIAANVFMTNHFYYRLLGYQAGSVEGKYLRAHQIAPGDVFVYKMEDPLNSLHFYARAVMPASDSLLYRGSKPYVMTMEKGLSDLKRDGIAYDIVQQSELFKVSELTPEFLNPKTREHAVKKYYLVRVR